MVMLTALKEAFKEMEKQLDRIIGGYSGKDIAKTYAYYSDGSIVKYDIVGTLNSSSINNMTNLVKVDIGNTVTSIGNNAFSGCYRLTSITIPDSVTSIVNDAFSGWTGLTSFNVATNNPVYSSQNGLLLTKNGKTVVAGVNGNVTIPDGVTSIGSHAFDGCSSLTSVTIPDSMTSIGDYAFYGCSRLTSITIPDGVTSIGSHAFNDCFGLIGSLTIPGNVMSIGDSAFSGCSGVTEITVLGTSINIDYAAFHVADLNNDHWLQTVYFPNLTMAEVEAMNNYPWDIPAGIPIVCKDGTMPTPGSGGDDSSS